MSIRAAFPSGSSILKLLRLFPFMNNLVTSETNAELAVNEPTDTQTQCCSPFSWLRLSPLCVSAVSVPVLCVSLSVSVSVLSSLSLTLLSLFVVAFLVGLEPLIGGNG